MAKVRVNNPRIVRVRETGQLLLTHEELSDRIGGSIQTMVCLDADGNKVESHPSKYSELKDNELPSQQLQNLKVLYLMEKVKQLEELLARQVQGDGVPVVEG